MNPAEHWEEQKAQMRFDDDGCPNFSLDQDAQEERGLNGDGMDAPFFDDVPV